MNIYNTTKPKKKKAPRRIRTLCALLLFSYQPNSLIPIRKIVFFKTISLFNQFFRNIPFEACFSPGDDRHRES